MSSYLERIQEIYKNTPMSRLMEYWQRAQSLSKGDEERAEAVCSNMLSLSESAPDWWTSMSKKKKKHFMGKKQPYVSKPKAEEKKVDPEPSAAAPDLITVPEPEPEKENPEEPVAADAPVEPEVPTSEEPAAEPAPVEEAQVSDEEPAEDDAVVPAEEEVPAANEAAEKPAADGAEVEEDDDTPVEPTGRRRPRADEPDDAEPEADEEEPEDDEPEPDWWHKLDKEEKQSYLEEHPASKFRVTPGDDEDEEAAPSWWLKLDTKEQEAYLEKHKDNPLNLKVDDPVSIKSAAKKVWAKKRAKSAAVISQHKTGLHALKTLFSGGELDHQQRSQAKKTAILGAKLVLGALVGIALFTALAPASAIIADMFLKHNGMSSESSDDESANVDPNLGDDKFSGEFLDKMHAWLMKQDLQELTQTVEKEKQNVQPKSA